MPLPALHTSTPCKPFPISLNHRGPEPRSTNLLVIRTHILDPPGEPLKGRLPRLEDLAEVDGGVLDPARHDCALRCERAELDGVAGAREEDEGPAGVVRLLTRWGSEFGKRM